MPKTIKQNKPTGQRAEAVIIEVLQKAGFAVTDLNELARNFPLADLVARRGSDRLLVQFSGTRSRAGWFQLSWDAVRKFATLADAVGHHAIYAFVHFDGTWSTTRFSTVEDVEDVLCDCVVTGSYEGLSIDAATLVDTCNIASILAKD